jgi:hypothetical protein
MAVDQYRARAAELRAQSKFERTKMLPLCLKPSLLVSSGSQILRRRLSNLSFHASLCSRTTHSEAAPDRSNWHRPNENFPIRLFPNQFPYGRLRRLAGWFSYCLDFVLSKPPPR